MYKTSQTCAIWSSDWMYYCRAPSNLTGPFGSTGEMDNSQGLLVHLPTKHGVCNECPLFWGVSNQNPHKEANLHVLFDFYLKNGTCGYMWCIECGALSFLRILEPQNWLFVEDQQTRAFLGSNTSNGGSKDQTFMKGLGWWWIVLYWRQSFVFAGVGHWAMGIDLTYFPLFLYVFDGRFVFPSDGFLNDVCLQLVGKMCFFAAIMSQHTRFFWRQL